VNGQSPTMRGYRARIDRSSIRGWLWGDERVEFVELLPDAYNNPAVQAHVKYLFPEAAITDRDPN